MIPALRWAPMRVMRAVFQVSLTVRNKVTWDCPQTTTFEERDQLKQNWTEVLCLPAKLAHWPARLVLQMTCLSNWKSAGTTYNWCLWWAQWFLRNPLHSVFGNASSKQVTGIHTAEAKHEPFPVSFTKWHSGLFGHTEQLTGYQSSESVVIHLKHSAFLGMHSKWMPLTLTIWWVGNQTTCWWSDLVWENETIHWQWQSYTQTIWWETKQTTHWQFGVRKTKPHTDDDKTTH